MTGKTADLKDFMPIDDMDESTSEVQATGEVGTILSRFGGNVKAEKRELDPKDEEFIRRNLWTMEGNS